MKCSLTNITLKWKYFLPWYKKFECVYLERYCQCLGSLSANQSLSLLDLYCRNDVYAIADSSTVNETGYPLKQVIPSKARCGSLNPYTMIRKDKCYCNNEPTTENKNSTEPSKIGNLSIFFR